MYTDHAHALIAAYRAGHWKPDQNGDLTFRATIDKAGHVLSIEPGAEGAGHPRQVGISAIDDMTMMTVNVGTAIWEARLASGLTYDEIAALNLCQDPYPSQEHSTQDAAR